MTNQTTDPLPTSQTSGYAHLSGASRAVAEAVSKPRWLIYLATGFAVLLAWVWLALFAAGVSSDAALGPGMAGIQNWLASLGLTAIENPVVAAILKICTPQQPLGFDITTFATGFAMWMTMSIAMMMPSAAPMLRTYGDIADVAVQKGEKVVPLVVLALGYLTVWAGFSLLASAVQLTMVVFGLTADTILPMHGVLAGVLLVFAGAYQFSNLKNACLEKCRNPFSILFGRWTTRPMGVFKLGLEQGFFCVGCCWALMLVMLVVGTMNLAWMAFFTLFTIIEKSGRGKVTSHWSGVILLVWGAGLIGLSLATN